MRAIENFNISGSKISNYPNLIKAFAIVKKSAAQANLECGILEKEKAEAIIKACDDIYNQKFNDQFPIDMIQGGAGTSCNMNFNEVIANRALQILGRELGDYKYISPNEHVNLSQSTNDVFATSTKLCIYLENFSLEKELENVINALDKKAEEFKDIIKIGRTQLQDAVPMTLGQTFKAYSTSLSLAYKSIKLNKKFLLNINLGGTAIGTGICSPPEFRAIIMKKLKENLSPLLTEECLAQIELENDLIYATSDTSGYVKYSNELKLIALKLIKICNDLRLLSSGPKCGLGEINLPQLQAGSSIMPGKVNPVLPEVIGQICYKIIGNDVTISLGCENAQLELNVFEPVMLYTILRSIDWLRHGLVLFVNKCINGITANIEKCKEEVYKSAALVTAFNPYLGYEKSTEILQEANKRNLSIIDIILEKKLLTKEEIDTILKIQNLINPVHLNIKAHI